MFKQAIYVPRRVSAVRTSPIKNLRRTRRHFTQFLGSQASLRHANQLYQEAPRDSPPFPAAFVLSTFSRSQANLRNANQPYQEASRDSPPFHTALVLSTFSGESPPCEPVLSRSFARLAAIPRSLSLMRANKNKNTLSARDFLHHVHLLPMASPVRDIQQL